MQLRIFAPMKLLSFLFLLCISNSFVFFSQRGQNNEGIIIGKIVDLVKEKPIEYVKVAVYNAKDSSLVFGQYTDIDGKFNIENLAYNSYYLKLSFSGYESQIIDYIELKSDFKISNVGVIKLSPQNEKQFDAVTVQGKQDILKTGIDKKVYNVGEDITLRGGTANDVLKNLPSIDLDQDGKVLLRGEGSVTILIDGRPSSLTGSNGKTLLDALPAGSIERIEIVTNPSAKYDPDGTSGIINIVLKKNKRKGYNGIANLNVGSGDIQNGNVMDGGVSLSYRNSFVNVFGSYTGRYLDGYRNNFLYSSQTVNDDSLVILDQNRFGTDYNAGHTFRTGVDFALRKNRTLAISSTGSIGDRIRGGDLWNARMSENALGENYITSLWKRTSYDPSQQQNLDINLNFKQNFKSNRGNISIDASQSFGKEQIQGYYTQSYFSVDTILLASKSVLEQRLSNIESNRISSLQFDGTYLWPELSLRSEWGVKGLIKHQVVDTYSETRDSMNLHYYEDTLSNFLYNYDENIISAYGILAHQYKRFKYQAGLRIEKAYQIPNLISDSIRIVNDYFNFFPSFHLKYVLTPKAEIGLSYSRRITRAGSSDLNPFTSYADPLNLQRGNPYLQPEYIDSYDLSYALESKKLNFSASIFYRRTTDMITRYKSFNEQNAAVVTMINLDNSHSLGTELVVNFKPFPWFRNTISSNINYIKYQTSNADWNRSGFNYNVKLNSSVDFWKKTASAQLNVNYIAPRITIMGSAQRRGSIDAAFEKKLGANWTIGGKVTDILNRQGFYMHLRQPTISQDVEYKWLTRRFYLIITYKFGKLEMNTKPKNSQDSNGSGDM